MPKELTPEEQKQIEQLRLRADWHEQGFLLEYRYVGAPEIEWTSILFPSWGKCYEYRRKPEPKYVPWTREDADQFRGIWVAEKRRPLMQSIIGAIDLRPDQEATLWINAGWYSFQQLFDRFTKLDGTPCGKLQ